MIEWTHVILAYGAFFIFLFGAWCGKKSKLAEVDIVAERGQIRTITITKDVSLDFNELENYTRLERPDEIIQYTTKDW